MKTARIPLFDWLIENLPKAKFDLANSSITGVKWSELVELTGFQIPADLNLNKNDPFGAPELRMVLGDIYKCDKSFVIPATGGSEANFIVFLAMVEPGAEVIVERPGYSPLWLVPQMLGAKIVPWYRTFEGGFALDLERLNELITERTKLVVFTNLHNPSGRLAPENDIKAAAELAAERGAILLIDEIFLDVANTPQTSAAMTGLENILVTSSVSKVYGIGGFRTGWIISPNDEITKKLLRAKWQGSVAAPYFSELVNAAALKYAREKLIQRTKKIASGNFPLVREWIENNTDILSWVSPNGGLLCYPQYKTKTKLGSVELGKKLMADCGVLLSPGEYFGLDGHFRMSYMLPENDLKYALNVVAEVIRKN